MIIKESIKIKKFGIDSDFLLSHLQSRYPFKQTEFSLILLDTYSPKRIDDVRRIVKSSGLNPKIYHSVFPEFDESDYSHAHLLELLFPDVWIKEDVEFSYKCKECGKSKRKIGYNPEIKKISSRKKIAMLEGIRMIVSKDVKTAIIDSGLTGCEFAPADPTFFYLVPVSKLGKPIMRKSEVRNLKGNCIKCDSPLFDVHFGPLRFYRNDWNGDDFVLSEYLDEILFSQKAYQFLKNYERKISKGDPVYLE